MSTTVATLAERALRRLGVAVVPLADRPGLSATVTVADIAGRALQALGVTVTDATSPPASTIIAVATIATAALTTLGVIASDETPSATDQALAVSKVNAIHDALIDRGFVSWASTAIPQAVSEDYVLLTAMHLAQAFGKAADPAQQPVLEARVGHVALVLQAQALAETKVAAVHDAMVAQAFVSWPTTAIPQAVAEDYVLLTALHLAPLFGKQGDPAQLPVLEGRVHAMALVLSAQDRAVEAVNGVHVNLAARGLVRWTVFDIPPAAEIPYILLAANDLAPLFGKPPSQPDEAGARRALAQVIALPTSGVSVAAAYF